MALQTSTLGAAETGIVALTQPCHASRRADDEIVVCGRSGERSRHRLPILPKTLEGSKKAEKTIGNGVAAATETEQVDVGGVPSNRVMVRLKIGL